MEKETICDSNVLTNLWWFSLDHTSEVYGGIYHSAINESLDFIWSGIRRSIHDFCVWGCHLEPLKRGHLTNLEDITESGYCMDTTAIRSVIRYCNSTLEHEICYCATAKFNEYLTLAPTSSLLFSSIVHQSLKEPYNFTIVKIDHQDNPLLSHPVYLFSFLLPPVDHSLGITIKVVPISICLTSSD